MVYEIYFEPTVGQWRIRIIKYYLFFFGVARIVQMRLNNEPTTEPVQFDNYDEAVQFVKERGIDKAYLKLERIRHYSTWLNAEGAHAANS